MTIIIGSISLVLTIVEIVGIVVGEIRYSKIKNTEERKEFGIELDNKIIVGGMVCVIVDVILFRLIQG